MTKRILFIGMHRPRRSPGQRFRYEQYVRHFQAAGWHCDHTWYVSERDDAVLYQPGRYAAKARIAGKGLFVRLADVERAHRYDLVFLHREALPFNWTGIERMLAATGTPIVFDFDDAIWLPPQSAPSGLARRLRGSAKLPAVLRRASAAIAGNAYLAQYALQHCRRVEMIPTSLDAERYRRVERPPNSVPVIGWSGSHSTVPYFHALTPALLRLRDALGGRVRFRMFGDPTYRNEALGVVGEPWREATEIEDTASFDIGLMPLPDDPWTRGKCGFKALLYMAVGVPAVVSPVGANLEIVDDGVNGLVAADEDAWVERLAALARDPALRARLAAAGRRTVEERYSVQANLPRYLALFEELTAR